MTSEDSQYKSLPIFDSGLEDWPLFRKKFRLYLESKDLLHIIDRQHDNEVLNDSAEEKSEKAAQMKNRRKDDIRVRGFLLNKLGSNNAMLVDEETTAFGMMARLNGQYDSNSMQSMVMKLDRLLDMEYKDKEITSHIAQMSALVNQLKMGGGMDWDKLFVVLLLRSMPKSSDWTGIVMALKTQDSDSLTRDKVCRTITERATELRASTGPTRREENGGKAAFHASDQRRSFGDTNCHNCGKPGHLKKNCWASGGGAEGMGPKAANSAGSAKWNGEPKRAHFAFMINADEKGTSWLIDSGATQHYTHDKTVFTTFRKTNDELRVADGRSVEITGVGSVKFNSRLENGDSTMFTLKEVYYAPKLAANLISLPKLDEHAGLKTRSDAGKMVFETKDGEVVFLASRTGAYFELNADVMRLKAANLTAEVWHARMGCLGCDSLKHLATSGMVDGMKVIGSFDVNCDVCAAGRSTRISFTESPNPRARHPLDLIHMDLVIINHKSRQGEIYALILIDDHSECKFAFPLKSKDGKSVLNALRDWLGWAERVTNRKLKATRSDNEKAFKFGVFAEWLSEMHVERQYSIPYEHEQNGKSERTNRTLLEKARCMLLRTGFEKSFWADALKCATFVANRSPVRGLDVTPIEKFTDTKPNLMKIRIFGAVGWAHVPNEKTHGHNKLEPRAVKCRLLHYTQGGHAYLVIAEDGSTFEAVSVKFIDSVVRNDLDIDLPLKELDLNFELDGEDEVREVMIQGEPETKDIEIPAEDEVNDEEEVEETELEPRRGTRERTKPRDYWKVKGNLNVDGPVVHRALLTYHEAVASKDWREWKAAMDEEVEKLTKYNVFELTELPAGKRAMGGKWVLTRKKDEVGAPGAYKARWVGKGFTQIHGIDYFDTFAPVVKSATVRIVLALATKLELEVRQGDVPVAYLNGEITEELFMVQIQGYETGHKVNKLLKGLYGTKQAGRGWNKTIHAALIEDEFTQSNHDPCLYFKGSMDELSMFLVIVLYVDDLLLIAHPSARHIVDRTMEMLIQRFKIRDMGVVHRFLGMIVSRNAKQHYIKQIELIDEVLERFGMCECKESATPMEANMTPLAWVEGDELCHKDYRSAVGSLMYLATNTRPDISYSVGILSRFLERPTENHWNMAMRVLRYIRGTRHIGLNYRTDENSFELVGWADADWAGDLETRRSCSGFIIYLAGCPVSWKSKRQTTVASSTTVAEIEALHKGVMEGIWISDLLLELGWKSPGAMVWHQDNQSAIKTIEAEKFMDRTKHLAVKISFLREKRERNIIKLNYTRTDDMVADILTKPLPRHAFEKHRDSLKLE